MNKYVLVSLLLFTCASSGCGWTWKVAEIYPGPDATLVWIRGSEHHSMSWMGGATNRSPIRVQAWYSDSLNDRGQRLHQERSLAEGWLRALSTDGEGHMNLIVEATDERGHGYRRVIPTSVVVPETEFSDVLQREPNVMLAAVTTYVNPEDPIAMDPKVSMCYWLSFSPFGSIAHRDDAVLFQEWQPDRMSRFQKWRGLRDTREGELGMYRPPFVFDRIDRVRRNVQEQYPQSRWIHVSPTTFLYYLGDQPVGVYVPHLSVIVPQGRVDLAHVFCHLDKAGLTVSDITVVTRGGQVHEFHGLRIRVPQSDPNSWLTLWEGEWREMLAPLLASR